MFTSETWPLALSKIPSGPEVLKYICEMFLISQWRIFNLPCPYILFYNWNWKGWQFHKLHCLHILALWGKCLFHKQSQYIIIIVIITQTNFFQWQIFIPMYNSIIRTVNWSDEK
jgi:hypothetical protein